MGCIHLLALQSPRCRGKVVFSLESSLEGRASPRMEEYFSHVRVSDVPSIWEI